MVWGMTLGTFTVVHVALSLIGIATGFVVMIGLLRGTRLKGWTGVFLLTTVAASVTGYGFPVARVLPSHIVGALSLAVLAIAIVALYGLHLRAGWRNVYVVCAALALYFNVFVGVVQGFLRIPALHALAPQQNEPPFVIVQLLVLGGFIVLTIAAAKRFRAGAAVRA